MVTLQYPNSDVADVLHLYETLTGKKLIVDNFVQGKVNIFISKPMPRDEAIKIIEMNLLLNGFSLVPAEHDIVKVIGTNRNPRAAGVPIISDEADIPPGEHVIRIEVDSSGYDASRRIRGVFKSGETRRLEATVDGLIKKDLTLVWGS